MKARAHFILVAVCALSQGIVGGEGARAHDIYAHLTNKSGRSCCDGTDCRPAEYRVSSLGVEMFVNGTWIWVPRGAVEYRSIAGDPGTTAGGHWCGEPYESGFITYCAFLPPSVVTVADMSHQ
jgi:hypothetical protein